LEDAEITTRNCISPQRGSERLKKRETTSPKKRGQKIPVVSLLTR